MILLSAIDLKNRKAVRLIQGDFKQETIYSEDPIALAKAFEKDGAKHLHIVDLNGAEDGKMIHEDIILNILKEASLKFGNQCVVLSIDAKKETDGTYKVYVEGGRKKTDLDAIDWAMEGVRLGAGEICINSIDQDGMKNGYDLELLSLLTKAVNVPIIASGGAGTKAHFLDALEKTDVDAVLAASVFRYKEIEIKVLKSYLKAQGIHVR